MARERWDFEDDEQGEDSAAPTGGLSGSGRCLFIGLVAIIIISLLGTAIVTITWLALSAWEAGRRTESLLQNSPTLERAATVAVATAVPTATLNSTATTESPAASGTPVVGAPAEPTQPELNDTTNRIVLINERRQVETVNPDGSDLRLLTDAGPAMTFQFPAWSPDGRSVAVIGSDLRGGGIYILADEAAPPDLSEQEVYFSTLGIPFYLYWSPNSELISFLANHEEDRISLNLVPRDGATESRVLTTGSPLYWNWTADSRQLFVHNGRGGMGARLTFLDLNGEEQTDNLTSPGFFQAPGISADGRYWAFAAGENFGLTSWLSITDVEGNEQRRERHDGSLALSWSPTANQLAFISGRGDSNSFYGALEVLDLDRGERRLLTSETVLAFFWSPDGRSIAYISLETGREGDITVMARPKLLAGNRLSSLDNIVTAGRTTDWVTQPEIPRFTLSVIDVASGTGLRLLEFQPTVLFLSQFLPFFDQYALSHRLWSPDSQALVIPVLDNGVERIVVVPVSGVQPRPIAEGEIGFWSQQ